MAFHQENSYTVDQIWNARGMGKTWPDRLKFWSSRWLLNPPSEREHRSSWEESCFRHWKPEPMLPGSARKIGTSLATMPEASSRRANFVDRRFKELALYQWNVRSALGSGVDLVPGSLLSMLVLMTKPFASGSIRSAFWSGPALDQSVRYRFDVREPAPFNADTFRIGRNSRKIRLLW